MELLGGVRDTSEVLEPRDEHDGPSVHEELEALVEVGHEPLELGVGVVKALGHDHGADDVADGAVEQGGRVDGPAIEVGVQGGHQLPDWASSRNIDPVLPVGDPILHPEMFVQQEGPVPFPQGTLGVHNAFKDTNNWV